MDVVLNELGADAHFTYFPDRTHFDLYATYLGGANSKPDPMGLFTQTGGEMYQVARPIADGRRQNRNAESLKASGIFKESYLKRD